MIGWFVESINRVLAVFDVRLVRASRHRSSQSRFLDPEARLDHVRELVTDQLNLIFLGSVGDRFTIPRNLADRIRVFSLDAFSPGSEAAATTRVLPLTCVVSGSGGPVEFIERSVRGVSSLLEPDAALIEAYGLDAFYRPVQKHRVEGVTLAMLAEQHGVGTWDFIKTDLEGLDFDVVRSLGDAICRTTLLQMELRFEPFYRGEPRFHEVAAYLEARGFQLLDLMPERWRYQTAYAMFASQGHAVFCNAMFVNRRQDNGTDAAITRKAFILGLMGYVNYAERLLQPMAGRRPDVVREMIDLLFPAASMRAPYLPVPGCSQVTHGVNE